jgi:enamine deaminase RidA (YjgF/YER057c/UK114 family)
MIKSCIPQGMAPPFARYSHGVSWSGLVMTSGQLALATDGSVPDGAEAQANLIFSNIDMILRDAGTTKNSTLKVSAFVTDRRHMAGYMVARDRWMIDVPHLPASTLMIVSGFTRPEFVVEIEVMAAGPDV